MNFKSASIVVLLLLIVSCGHGPKYPYLNTKLSFEERAEDLVSRMTLEEKVSQLSYEAGAVKRLGIPQYNWWNECLHGVARAGKATVFPQAIGMAASFDREMMLKMAEVTSDEARAKYNDFEAREKRGIYQGLTFWSPNINIFRDPRWGRGHETYGEDPYLTGEMAVQFIRGLQGDDPRYLKVVATAKHFVVHSGPEPLRHEFNAVTGEQDFRDTYLPAFKKSVEKGKVYSVMCAYNRYMGEPCCGSIPLQQELLREELGFEGYIVSDCGAISDFHAGHQVVKTREEAAAKGVISGTDLNCGKQYLSLVQAVEQGLILESEVDLSVQRLMLARMKLGMFDPVGMVPWSGITLEDVAGEAHKKVAAAMARKTMVLLKNDQGVLPLNKEIAKLAVIGPNADNVDVQYGNYNGSPVDPVSVFEGIKAKLGDRSQVKYALGTPHHEGLPYLSSVPEGFFFTDQEGTRPGLNAAFYANLEAMGDPVVERTDATVDYYWWDGEPPVEGVEDDHYSVSWTGYLVPRTSGRYAIGVEGKYFHFIFEGDTLLRMNNIHHPAKSYQWIDLEEGKSYRVKLVMEDRHGDSPIIIHWDLPNPDRIGEAVRLARWADHIVLVMGLTPRLEGEEMRGLVLDGFDRGDRTSLDLPETQRRLIRRIVATGKPVTLVLMSGSALSINWENQHIPSILQAWYGGESAGSAVADVLFGDYNPAGRLPVTFYKSVEDLPDFDNYDMQERTYRYFDGEVLYPFGYGLSYTSFSYNNLILERDEITPHGELTVSVEVTNTGQFDGEEVVQMYIRKPESSQLRPLKELRGFERVFINKGQTRVVTMTLGQDELEIFDPRADAYMVEKGVYEVMAGPSSDDAHLIQTSLMVR